MSEDLSQDYGFLHLREELHNLKQELSDKMNAIDERLASHTQESRERLRDLERFTNNIDSRRQQTDQIIYGDHSENSGLIGLQRDIRRATKVAGVIGAPVTLFVIYDFLNRLLALL